MIWLSAHNGASFIELVLPPVDETPQDTRYKIQVALKIEYGFYRL
jgi:hypothetical protein